MRLQTYTQTLRLQDMVEHGENGHESSVPRFLKIPGSRTQASHHFVHRERDSLPYPNHPLPRPTAAPQPHRHQRPTPLLGFVAEFVA